MGNSRLREKAIKNNLYRKEHFAEKIQYSYDNSAIHDGSAHDEFNLEKPRYGKTNTNVLNLDIRQFLRTYKKEFNGTTAVLNFASYKHPGGGYMAGMMAQEEALCHCTTLYEVLEKQSDYYSWNKNNLNKGMYKDRMIYTPNVLILNELNGIIGEVDVITCAAPNMSVGLKYGSFTEQQCQTSFYNRVKFLMHMAAYHNVDNLILGAWCCGVFKNDVDFVAKSFFSAQRIYDGYFRNIIYVILDEGMYCGFLRGLATN